MAKKKSAGGIPADIWRKQPENGARSAGIAGTALGIQTDVLPKYKTFDVITLRISRADFEFLHNLERDIMKNRSSENKKERITKNTVVRAMLSCFRNIKFDKDEIPNEAELRARIMKGLKEHPSWLF